MVDPNKLVQTKDDTRQVKSFIPTGQGIIIKKIRNKLGIIENKY